MYIITLSFGETNLFLKKTQRERTAHAIFMLLGNHGNAINRFIGLTHDQGHKISILKVEEGAEHFTVWEKARDLLHVVMEDELIPPNEDIIDALT